jgi:transcriptional regulator with XRE-family HTH domain
MSYAFAETMRERMEAKGLDIGGLAAKVGCSPEHVRKLCNSETFPSRALREAIADLLEIDRVEFEKQANADRWREKYGKIPAVSQAQHPIYAVWDELTKDQRTSLLCMAKCMARQKRRKVL